MQLRKPNTTAAITAALKPDAPQTATAEIKKPATNPLAAHIAVFARPDGYVSYDSMEAKLEQLGDKPDDAKSLANKVSLAGGLKTHWRPYAMFTPAEGATALTHSQSTGIYNADGTLNEKYFNRFLNLAQTDDSGKKYITQSAFYAELAKKRAEDNNNWLGVDKEISDGEWKAFWEKFNEMGTLTFGCDLTLMSPDEKKLQNSDATHLRLYKEKNELFYYIDDKEHRIDTKHHTEIEKLFSRIAPKKEIISNDILKNNELKPEERQACIKLITETAKLKHTLHYKKIDEPCVTLDTFKQFYLDPAIAFGRVEKHELPKTLRCPFKH